MFSDQNGNSLSVKDMNHTSASAAKHIPYANYSDEKLLATYVQMNKDKKPVPMTLVNEIHSRDLIKKYETEEDYQRAVNKII